MTLKKAFRLALTHRGASASDFAADIGKSKQFVSRVASGKEQSAPGMKQILHDFSHKELLALRDELNRGIYINA